MIEMSKITTYSKALLFSVGLFLTIMTGTVVASCTLGDYPATPQPTTVITEPVPNFTQPVPVGSYPGDSDIMIKEGYTGRFDAEPPQVVSVLMDGLGHDDAECDDMGGTYYAAYRLCYRVDY